MPQHGQDGHGITTQANPAMPPRIGQPLVKYSVVDARSTIGAQREAILARGARLPVGRIGRPEEVAALDMRPGRSEEMVVKPVRPRRRSEAQSR
jgi:hypothetical protein